MQSIFGFILFGCCVLAVYQAVTITLHKKSRRMTTSKLLVFLSAASALWSFGYGMMQTASSPDSFVVYRAMGYIGIVLFMTAGQSTIIYISDFRKINYVLIAEIVLGVIFLISILNPSCFTIEEKGVSYVATLTSPFAIGIYLTFIALAIAIFMVLAAFMTRSGTKQYKAIGRSLFVFGVLVLIGAFIDVVFPRVSFLESIPASATTQFIGLILLSIAIRRYNRNTLSIGNVSSYIYEAVRLPVCVFDTNHTLMFANDKAYEVLHLSTDKPLSEHNIWSDNFNAQPPLGIEESTETVILDIVVHDGQMNIRINIDPIFDEFGDYKGYILTTLDMTEHIKNQQLEESSKMKTQFLANMSHEIRTPLNAILGFNEAILQDPADVIKVNAYANNISEAGENLKDIINSILDISKIEMGQLQIESKEYSTIQMLDNLASMFEMMAEKKGLTLYTEIDNNLPRVMIGDEAHLRQILTNILNNAVKYTDVGSIVFKAKVVSKEPGSPTCRVLFSVKDTGRGIREEDKERLFRKFERLDTEHFKHVEGTGLGMSIVQLTLKAMGSEIKLESTYGVGSRFYFELDQIALDAEAIGNFEERRAENAIKEVRSNDFRAPEARILIVDDVEMNCDAAIALLSFTKMQIDKALSGRAAIEMLEKTRYDLIFMDHMMPEMDGIEATERIRNISVEKNDAYFAMVPIIALTANALVGVREMYQNAGMQDFISKPIELNTMVGVLQKWLPKNKIEKASAEEIQAHEAALADAIKEWEIDIPGIDIEEARKYNPDTESLNKNMTALARGYAANKREIEGYFDAADLKNYVIKVHGLKSTSKMIGAMELSEQARELEAKGNEGELDAAGNSNLMKLYDEVITSVKEYLGMGEESADNNNELSADEYTGLIARIKAAADSFDAGAFMSLEEELDKVAAPESEKENFSRIKEMVSMLSFGQLTAFIEEMESTR